MNESPFADISLWEHSARFSTVQYSVCRQGFALHVEKKRPFCSIFTCLTVCEMDCFVLSLCWYETKYSVVFFYHFSLSPYIIGTTNQPVKMTPNHGLHLSFRWELSFQFIHINYYAHMHYLSWYFTEQNVSVCIDNRSTQLPKSLLFYYQYNNS